MLRHHLLGLHGLAIFLFSAIASAAPIDVYVLDALTGAAQPGQRVDVREILADGSSKWLDREDTDNRGIVSFNLDGLGSGKRFIFKTLPENRGWVTSREVASGPRFFFEVGHLPVTLVHPATKQPLAETEVTLREVQSDGSLKWVRRQTTDSSGQTLFDAPGLGTSRNYILEAKSPLDNGTRRTATITQRGAHSFQVGNDPLRLTVIDALTQTPLAGLSITAEEFDGDRFRSRKTITTDSNGTALLDLTGLGGDREYRLRSKPWGHSIYSKMLSQTGPFTFALGTTRATVSSGANNTAMANTEVHAYELDDEGKRHWRAETLTDSQGVARFHLSGLGSGTDYQLGATSLVDGKRKYSQPLNAVGAVDFVVGNAPLTVTVQNHFTGTAIAGLEVSARERLADGASRWVGKTDTDQQGNVVFDLEGLGSGRQYYLQTTPYTTGRAQTLELNQTGNFVFSVGKLAVQLKNKDNNQALANTRLQVYEKTSDGKLHSRGSGDTNNNGLLRFDPYGIGQPGRLYVLKASDPFGDGKHYYSNLINSPRQFVLALTPGKRNYPDRTLPDIKIITPQPGQPVGDRGVQVLGVATDNEQMRQVRVRVTQLGGGDMYVNAQLNIESGFFTAHIPRWLLNTGTILNTAILAEDDSANIAELAQTNPVQQDSAPPSLSVDTHANGARVYRSGFLISGQLNDGTQVAELNAQISNAGNPLLTKTLDWSYSTGRWSFYVPPETVPAGADLDLLLVARDTSGNPAQIRQQLVEANENIDSLQLARRASFGPNAELLRDIRRIGSDAWLSEQLNPGSIDDTALDTVLSVIDPPTSTGRLQEWTLAHMLFSRAQLREVMTQFWDNHFNTNRDSHGRTEYELQENQAFRANAFGHFRDLLEISAKSPAMLMYLDNARSRKEDPNENYAREVSELHTLGVNGGYTQQDLEEIARALTGWTVKSRAFHYEPRYHDDDEKTVLGHLIPAGGGINDGETVLDILASHPSTASFICTKLVKLFITDTPSTDVVDDCAEAFSNSDGHIGTVVGHILRSPAFSAPEHFQRKTKTPLEQTIGLARAVGANISLRHLRYRLGDLGMPLFQNPVPTGYAETGSKWINSQQIQSRVRLANEVAFNRASEYRTYLDDPRMDILSSGHHTAEGITAFLGQLALGNDWSDLEWNLTKNVLRGPGDPPFDISDTDSADEALRSLIGTVFSLPSAQLH